MSNFAITADEVKKILAEAQHLTQEVDGQRYEAEDGWNSFKSFPKNA